MDDCFQKNRVIQKIKDDYEELRLFYPFSSILFMEDSSVYVACITTVAVCSELIEALNGRKEDFTGEYSKTVYVFIPWDYKAKGCCVYGCKWIDFAAIPYEDKHFYADLVNSAYGERKEQYGFLLTPFGYRMCVGTPESFSGMKNVVLENVKTAESMLIAYEQFMEGQNTKINLLSYRHGYLGRKDYLSEHAFGASIG